MKNFFYGQLSFFDGDGAFFSFSPWFKPRMCESQVIWSNPK